METYKVSYYWTREELMRSMRHHYQTNLRPQVVQAVNIFSVFLTALSLSLLFVDGLKPSAIMTASLFTGFAIYWSLLRRRMGDWWFGRKFDKRFGKVLMEWEFTSEKVACRCEEISYTEAEWKVFIKLAEANDGFLLYTRHNLFYWLPFSAFEHAEGIEQVRQFAKNSGLKYVQLTGWGGTPLT